MGIIITSVCEYGRIDLLSFSISYHGPDISSHTSTHSFCYIPPQTIVLVSVSVASAAPQEGYNYQAPTGQGSQFSSGAGQFSGTGQFAGSGQYSGDGQFAPAQYSFQWDVNSQAYGNFYGHKEQRENDYTEGR